MSEVDVLVFEFREQLTLETQKKLEAFNLHLFDYIYEYLSYAFLYSAHLYYFYFVLVRQNIIKTHELIVIVNHK